MLIWRLTPPAILALPTSRTVCRRLTMTWSASVVRIVALNQGFLDLGPESGADLLDLFANILQGDGRRHRELEFGDDDRLAFERA